MLQSKLQEIRIRVKEEINQKTVQDIFHLILESDTVEEFVQCDYILTDMCDRLYQEYDTKTNMDNDFYGILNKVDGIQDDQITEFVDSLQDHEFNVYFQHYLQYKIHRLDPLLEEDTRRTKLTDYSKERLDLFFQESTHQDQEKVLRIFYKNDRKDLLLLVSKGFGISLRNYKLESPILTDEEDEVVISITEETSPGLSEDEDYNYNESCDIWPDDIL